MNFAEFIVSPPMSFMFIPSVFICRAIGAACWSYPPKKMASGFCALIDVSSAAKSTALSFVCSRLTTCPPEAFTAFSNSSASPCP